MSFILINDLNNP